MQADESKREFQTTNWSIVLDSRRAAKVGARVRQEALCSLCEQYWSPLYAYLRRKGFGPDETSDLVQGFFTELIEKDFVDAVEQDRGRFRWFLMNAVSRFAAKQHQRQTAQKRGGDRKIYSIAIDPDSAERTYRNEPVDGWTAEKLFDRRWGIEVLRRALQILESEYQSNSPELFIALRSRLSIDKDDLPAYAEIAEQLGMTPAAVKTAAARLRKRYQLLLRRMVADTLDDTQSVDDELDILLAAIRG